MLRLMVGCEYLTDTVSLRTFVYGVFVHVIPTSHLAKLYIITRAIPKDIKR